MTCTMDVKFLGTLCVILWTSILVQASFAPVNLAIHMLNFNLTLTWEPPEVEPLENEHFLYTVERTTDKDGCPIGNVPQCVSILETVCSLLPVFPQGRGFCTREFFKVTSFSNINSSRRGSRKETFSGSDIEVSAPVVYNSTFTDRNITLWIRGPDTPFEKNGKKMVMIEDVGVGLHLDELKFNASLFESSNPNYIGRLWTSGDVTNGRYKVKYDKLDPNKAYVIRMQSTYNKKLSSNITTFQFRTAQSAPEYGPIISGFEVVKRYCDFRDVNVTWEERKIQRQTVNITDYEVSFKSVNEPGNDVNVVVPASVQSTNVSGLVRWLKYHVTITSRNSGGKKEGQMSVLKEDEELIDTYKAEIKGITRASSREGKITWEPPRLHEQCILGYDIKTYIDGSLEQSLTVNGYNTSSAIIEFKKSGKYNIDLEPIYNDTLDKGTGAKTTNDYILKAWKGYEGTILFIVLFLVIAMLSGGVTRRLICATKNLPDFSKIKPMRIASNDHYVNTSLKEPPEKEFFDSTRGRSITAIKCSPNRGSSITEIKCIPKCTIDHDDNDEVFHPASTSETPLFTENITNNKSENIVEVQTAEKSDVKNATDQQEMTSVKFQIREVDSSTTVQVTTSSTNLEASVTFYGDGYVPRSPKKNPPLTVTIPKDEEYCSTSRFSAQSSSADSGICSSPIQFPDYVPPSPFADSITEFNIMSCTSDSEEFPYVKADLAVASGRIESQSVSSETGSDCPNYNRVDSTQFVIEPPPNGNLPMCPSHPIDLENMNAKGDTRPCSLFFP